MDSTAIHALKDIFDDLKKSGIDMYFSGVKGPVRDALQKAGFVDYIGEDKFFLHIQYAVDNFDEKSEGTPLEIVLQTDE